MQIDRNIYLINLLKEISYHPNPLKLLEKGLSGFCSTMGISACGFFTMHAVYDSLFHLFSNISPQKLESLTEDEALFHTILNNQKESYIHLEDGMVLNGSKIKLFIESHALNDQELNSLWFFLESLNDKEKIFVQESHITADKEVDFGFVQMNKKNEVTYICPFCRQHFPYIQLREPIDKYFDTQAGFRPKLKNKRHLKIIPYQAAEKDNFLFVLDLTTVNQTIRNQKERLYYFENFFDNLNDALLITGRISSFIKINAAARKLLCIPDDVPESNYKLSSFIHPDDLPQAQGLFDKLSSEGHVENFSCRIVALDGTIKYIQASSSAIFDEDNNLVGARNMVRDISESVRLIENLKKREHVNRCIIETSQDAILITDKEGSILQFNKSTVPLFGRATEYIKGATIHSLIDFSLIKESNDDNLDFLLDKDNHIKYNRFETKGFHPKVKLDVEIAIAAIHEKDQTLFSFFVRDISDGKRAQRSLLEAIQRADNARVMEQQFLATMSHEIRTPMNAVVGMTHLLSDTELSEIQRDYLNALLFSADSLMDVLTNILDLSKIESGEMVFEKLPFDLEELVKSLIRTTHFQVKGKPISVDYYVDGRINKLLLGDKAKLTQVLSNLLNNATKFTSKGYINCNIQVKKETPTKYLLSIEVRDSGIGIAAEKARDVFKSFKQADQSIRRKFGGTGLGLSIVKQLIERQGGTIQLKSEIGVGTTFLIVMPFEKSTQPKITSSQHKEHSNSYSEKLKSYKLLVVEDNLMNQKLISKIFTKWGAYYKIAGSGFQALEYTRQEKFDLIFMDIHMPDMDGYQTAQLIQQDRTNKNSATRIIALTASALQKEKTKALAIGMVDFLTKPFTPDTLKNVLLKWDKVEDFNEETKVLDLSFVEKLGKRDSHFVKEMIQIFLNEVPNGMVQIHEAIKTDDKYTINQSSHRIKSNFLIMGMHSLVEKASKLEQLANEEEPDWTQISQLVFEMDKENASIRPILEEKLKAYQVKARG